MQPDVQQSEAPFQLVDLPFNLSGFRSVASDTPPFLALLLWLSRRSRRDLRFGDIAIGPFDFATLRAEVHAWIRFRHQHGLAHGLPFELDLLSIQGATAPMLNRRLRRGHALVAAGGAR